MNDVERIDPRVLGQRLAEARKARGVTQEAAAKHLGLSRPTFIAIEKGTRRPRPEETVKLAGYYGRSLHELVRPGAPAVELEPHLRAVVTGSRGEREDVIQAIRELQGFAEDYRELERLAGAKPIENYPAEVSPHGVGLASFAEDVAVRERARLHLGDQPIADLRGVLENSVGVRVFCTPLPSHLAGMYAYVADLGYCILVNAKHPRERQRWTLAHEYGHFLADRHKPGIDYTEPTERVPAGERFADAFAMGFLVPATGVRAAFFEVVGSHGDFQVADLCRISSFYQVSIQAMTLRLESLSLIRKGTWDLLREQGFKAEAAKRSLDLVRERTNDEPYPARYKYLAVLAFREGKISEGQLARFLRTDRVAAREVVQRCTSRTDDIGPDGRDAMFEVPLERSLINAS
jgi:Zn-dependent peptidase ImmA (M78 family)/transcriptional regulator with XRE-family HTH domain